MSPEAEPPWDPGTFERELAESRRIEARLPWKQLLALALVVGVAVARWVWFL